MKNFAANKNYNKVEVCGYVFDQDLTIRTYSETSRNPGMLYIAGKINVAIDAAATEVVPVYFSWVNKYYKNGKENGTFEVLNSILENKTTVTDCGIGKAVRVRIQGDVENTCFVGNDGTLVDRHRIRGSFVHRDENPVFKGYATFQTDALFTGYREVQPDDGEEHGILKGYAFNYRNEIFPVEYNVPKSSGGMAYFDNFDVSAKNPLLTNVWGNIVVNTIVKNRETETAFGAPAVQSTERKFITWDISGAAPEEMAFGDEDVMTQADVERLINLHEQNEIADAKRRYEERNGKASSFSAPASNVSAPVAAAPAADDFAF